MAETIGSGLHHSVETHQSASCSTSGTKSNQYGNGIYRIYSHNLRTFFPSLAAEKSGCVKYADFFWRP
jgi:hypothetical protein